MKKILIASLFAATVLAACGGGDDAPASAPPATSEVPASASQSSDGFIAYLQLLVASMADTLSRSTPAPSSRRRTTPANR